MNESNRTNKGVWKMFLSVLLLAVFANPAKAADECQATRLVVLAGPRRSATTSVAEFFHLYARGPQPGRAHGKIYHPLAKFRWPLVYGVEANKTETEMPYKRYNKLVTDPDNKELKDEILEAIKNDYDNDKVDAVIFGGEEFDNVLGGDKGEFGFAAQKYDAVKAVQEVVDYVGVPGECVEIIINYRIPRFEHWVSLYASSTHEEEIVPYEQHMCTDKTADVRLQELGTSMNPMYLAETYLAAQPGWKVKLIDMSGVEDFGTDISHTIACDILGGICKDEGRWVSGHIEEVISNKVLQADFDSLPDKEVDLSEKLFEYRDCGYQEDLQNNDRFEIVKQKDIWADCQHDKDHEWIYQSFRNFRIGTHLVFDALLSQVNCKKFGGHPTWAGSKSKELQAAKIQDFLKGTYQKKHNFLDILEEDVDKAFSTPLILVILMFAAGAGFYTMKFRDVPGYQVSIPNFEMGSFEMGGFSPQGMVDGISGFAGGFSDNINSFAGGFSDNINKKFDRTIPDDEDDDSSSGDEESDSDSDAGEFI